MITEKEYLHKVCKENRFTLKLKQIKTEDSNAIKTMITNIDELTKWRARYGITQKDMITIGMLGVNLRKYQLLEEGHPFIGPTVMKKLRIADLVDLEFIEEENNE